MNETAADGSSDAAAGGGGAIDVFLGGAISPTLVLGGTFAFQQMSKPTITVNGHDYDAQNDANVGVLGFTAEGFAGPESGFHYSGTLGLGSLTISDQNGNTLVSANGFGYGVALGYDFKVSNDWYLGIGARFIGAATKYQGSSENTFAFAVMADALYF
jgi:hypothetical protein